MNTLYESEIEIDSVSTCGYHWGIDKSRMYRARRSEVHNEVTNSCEKENVHTNQHTLLASMNTTWSVWRQNGMYTQLLSAASRVGKLREALSSTLHPNLSISCL